MIQATRTGTGPWLAPLPFFFFLACEGDLMPTATHEPALQAPGEVDSAQVLGPLAQMGQAQVCAPLEPSTEEVLPGVSLTWDSSFLCENAPEEGAFQILVSVSNDSGSDEAVTLEEIILAFTTPRPAGGQMLSRPGYASASGPPPGVPNGPPPGVPNGPPPGVPAGPPPGGGSGPPPGVVTGPPPGIPPSVPTGGPTSPPAPSGPAADISAVEGLPLSLAAGATGTFSVDGTYKLVETDEGAKANLHFRAKGRGATSGSPFRLGINVLIRASGVQP